MSTWHFMIQLWVVLWIPQASILRKDGWKRASGWQKPLTALRLFVGVSIGILFVCLDRRKCKSSNSGKRPISKFPILQRFQKFSNGLETIPENKSICCPLGKIDLSYHRFCQLLGLCLKQSSTYTHFALLNICLNQKKFLCQECQSGKDLRSQLSLVFVLKNVHKTILAKKVFDNFNNNKQQDKTTLQQKHPFKTPGL